MCGGFWSLSGGRWWQLLEDRFYQTIAASMDSLLQRVFLLSWSISDLGQPDLYHRNACWGGSCLCGHLYASTASLRRAVPFSQVAYPSISIFSRAAPPCHLAGFVPSVLHSIIDCWYPSIRQFVSIQPPFDAVNLLA